MIKQQECFAIKPYFTTNQLKQTKKHKSAPAIWFIIVITFIVKSQPNIEISQTLPNVITGENESTLKQYVLQN